MASKEHRIILDVIKNSGRNYRLFRANCGQGWVGNVIEHGETPKGVKWLKIANPRVLHGLPEGFSDIFGLQTIEITQEMVGSKIAMFVAKEVKTGSIPLTAEQKLFGEMVLKMGGGFEVVRK